MDPDDSPALDNMSSWSTEEHADMIPFENSSSNISENLPYYGSAFAQYNAFYAYSIHGYISVSVCSFGIIASIMNIIVLTRKDMMSPINIIFTGLAFADMMVMITTLPFNIHYYIQRSAQDIGRYTIYGWAVYEILYNYIVLVNHTISTWLTVTVAFWRYLAVCHPTPTLHWRSLKRARIGTALTYIICPIFCIPMYLVFIIREIYDEEFGYLYYVDYSELAKKNNFLLFYIDFWIYSVITKLVPCIALTGLSFLLIRALYKANIRRKELKVVHVSQDGRDRITKLLLVVLLLFMIAEFPYGMLALMSVILGRDFLVNVYSNLVETMEDIILVNCAVNFIIYCSMSRQFRDTFVSLFLTRWRRMNTSIRDKMRAMQSAHNRKITRF